MESVSDAVQLAVLAACFALSLLRAQRERGTAWTAVACFYACMLLGNAYWLGYQLVFGDIPHYSRIAELSWIAGYVFLIILAVELDRGRGVVAPVPAAWVPVAACAACCVFYIVDSGSPLLNIADNGLLAAVGFFAVRGIVAPVARSAEDGRLAGSLVSNRPLHAALLAFVAVEQALWLASCLPEPELLKGVDLYIVLNYVLTLSYAAILACAWRSGKA